MPSADRVLREIAERPASRRTQRIAQDADSFDHGFALAVRIRAGRADDSDLEPRAGQSLALLPDATVARHRQVLDEDEYVAPHLLALSLSAPRPKTRSSIACSAAATLRSR